MNDTEVPLDAIDDLAARHSVAGVEVMPFHALGRDKRHRLGRPGGPNWSSANARQSREWLEALASRDCKTRLG